LIAPISEDQREAIRGVLEEQGIDEPDMIDKMKTFLVEMQKLSIEKQKI
jgi:hypothetical protein